MAARLKIITTGWVEIEPWRGESAGWQTGSGLNDVRSSREKPLPFAYTRQPHWKNNHEIEKKSLKKHTALVETQIGVEMAVKSTDCC